MKKYYYFPYLEDSLYRLSIDEALHFGATSRLPIYFYLAQTLAGKETVMIPELMQDFEDGEASRFSGQDTRKKVPIGTEYRRDFSDEFLRADLGTIRHFEKNHYIQQPVISAYVDNRTLPIFDDLKAPREQLLRHVQFRPGSQPHITLSELICFSDDLDTLVQQGIVERREDQTEKLSQNFRAIHDAIANGELREVEALFLAWGKFWKNADRADKDTWTKKSEVTNWLTEQGLSAKLADSGATMIKPQWAKDQS